MSSCAARRGSMSANGSNQTPKRKTSWSFFTALNQEHDYREGQRVGCDLYLTKPQNPKDIVEKVREFLRAKVSQT